MLLFSLMVVFLLIMLYCIFLLKMHSKSIPFLILFLVYMFWDFVSIVYIDNGAYISEQNSYSYFTGASFRFVMIMLPFVLGAPILFSLFTKSCSLMKSRMILFEIKENIMSKIILTFSLLLCGYLILDEIVSGIPLFHQEITQFNFYNTYSRLPLAEFLAGIFLGYLLLVCGIFFAKKKSFSNKVPYVIVYVLTIVYRIFLGEKFYPFLVLTIEFFIPTLIMSFDINYKSIISILKRNSKWIKRMIIFIAILLYVVYYKYSKEQSATYGSAIEHLISRAFALQSHTFWGFDNYIVINDYGFDFNRIMQEMLSGLQGVDKLDSSYGLTRIMYIVSPKSIVDMYIGNSTRFYGGYWTVALGCFGYYMAIIYSLLMALVFAFISSILYSTIKNREYFIMFIAFMGYFNFFKYFNEGDFIFLLSTRMLISVGILVFYRIIKKVKYKRS